MSKKTVLDCPESTSPADSDYLYLIKGLSDFKLRLSSLKSFILSAATKATVGLSNVPNWSGDTSTNLGTSNTKFASQGAIKKYVDSSIESLRGAILGIVHPVGDDYIQLPGGKTPSQKGWPGTWENVSSEDAGDFYRIEGGAASTFGSGQQSHQFQEHAHAMTGIVNGGNCNGTDRLKTGDTSQTNGYTGHSLVGSPTQANHGVPQTGAETRPVNKTIRKWRRIA